MAYGDPSLDGPAADGRVLTCRCCHAPVQVIEAPSEFLIPERFVCGQCLHPVQTAESFIPEKRAA